MMSNSFKALASFSLVAGLLAGCGKTEPTAQATAVHRGAFKNYILSSEPDGAVGVVAAREKAEDKKPLVVVGRVGGGIKPWIEGRAAFVMVDAAAAFEADDQCPDGCNCHADELADATTLVKFLDEQGRTLEIDARELLGIKESQMVVVRGKAKRDQDGNLTVMADGLYIRR